MVSTIVEGIMQKAIRRSAKKMGKDTSEVQLMIAWNDEENTPKYKRMALGVQTEEIPFTEILGLPVDIMGYKYIVAQFITNRYEEYSEEFGCDKKHLFIVVMLEETEDSDNLKLILFRGGQEIREIKLEQLLM